MQWLQAQGDHYRNAPVVGGLAGGAAHLQSCQAFLTAPASTVLAEASRGVKIVALSSFHPPTKIIAADFHAEGQESPTVDIDQETGDQSCLRLSASRCSIYIYRIGDSSMIPTPRRYGGYG